MDKIEKYFSFKGRASRGEYFTITGICLFIGTLLFFIFRTSPVGEVWDMSLIFDVLIKKMPFIIFLIIGIWPFVAVGVRRLHDVGRSGSWYVAFLIIIVMNIIRIDGSINLVLSNIIFSHVLFLISVAFYIVAALFPGIRVLIKQFNKEGKNEEWFIAMLMFFLAILMVFVLISTSNSLFIEVGSFVNYILGKCFLVIAMYVGVLLILPGMKEGVME